MTSLFQEHVQRWQNCTACELCNGRTKVVLARGQVPADIVICGEAPGPSEDVIGVPFVGPAGHLLNQIVKRAIPSHLRMAFTNLVSCCPRDSEGDKLAEPEPEHIEACEPRLIEFVRMCKPRLIVCVGALAKAYIIGQAQFDPVDWLPDGKFVEFVNITHPAAIIRANYAMRGLMVQKCVVTLANAVEEVLGV